MKTTLSNISVFAHERVDFENKIIYGTSACMAGEAKGHGVFLSDNFIQKLVALANAKGKISVHLGHFNECAGSDEMETILGFAKNFRYENGKALCDIHFEYVAKDAEDIDKILTYTQNHPEHFGQSIVFQMQYDEQGNTLYEENPNADGKEYATIGDIFSTDIVEHPAANADGMFSTFGKASTAKQATEALDKLKTRNKSLFSRIESFVSKYFASKPEALPTDLPETQTTEQPTPNNKKNMFSFFKKKPAVPETAPKIKKLGEAVDAAGILYEFEGEELMAGYPLVIVAPDGSSEIAKAGDYEMSSGHIVTIAGDAGQISAVTAPTMAVDPAQVVASDAELGRLTAHQLLVLANAQRREAAALAELEKIKGMVSNAPIAPTPETVMNATQKRELFNAYRAFAKGGKMAGLTEKEAALAKKMQQKDASFEQVAAAYKKMNVSFATGAEFESSVVTACIQFFSDVFVSDTFTDDLFLSKIKDVTNNMPYKPNNMLNVRLPLADMETAVGKTTLVADNGGCTIEPDTVVAKLSERTMPIGAFGLNWSVCPADDEWRQLFNQMVFVDELTIPLEVVFMNKIMELLTQDQVEILVNCNSGYGPHGADTKIDGIVKQLGDSIANTEIPAAQLFAGHVAWTTSNVQDFFSQAVAAIPNYIKQKSRKNNASILFYVSDTVWNLYLESIRLSNPNPYFLNPDTAAIYSYPNSFGLKIEFVPVVALDRFAMAVNNGLYFITLQDRVLYEHSDKLAPRPGSPFVERIPGTGVILTRFGLYMGIGYAYAKDFVTNIPTTD